MSVRKDFEFFYWKNHAATSLPLAPNHTFLVPLHICPSVLPIRSASQVQCLSNRGLQIRSFFLPLNLSASTLVPLSKSSQLAGKTVEATLWFFYRLSKPNFTNLHSGSCHFSNGSIYLEAKLLI